MRYMLETNIVSDVIRNPGGRTTRRLEAVGERAVCIGITDHTLVTANEREFSRIAGLRLENWLEAI